MNPEINLFAPPPAYNETQIESQQQKQNHIVARYKIERRLVICLSISIVINIMLVFLLGVIIIDPLYNRHGRNGC